jgi:hypothetical protein
MMPLVPTSGLTVSWESNFRASSHGIVESSCLFVVWGHGVAVGAGMLAQAV